MIVLNEVEVFEYSYTCKCRAKLQVEESDLDCYKVSGLNVDYLFIVECPVCGATKSVPAIKIPKRMRVDLKKIANSGSDKKAMA